MPAVGSITLSDPPTETEANYALLNSQTHTAVALPGIELAVFQ